MITFRPDTSFPYLKIARENGVDYGEVLRFADTIKGVKESDWDRPQWQCAVCAAWLDENQRRYDMRHGRSLQMDPGPAGMDLS